MPLNDKPIRPRLTVTTHLMTDGSLRPDGSYLRACDGLLMAATGDWPVGTLFELCSGCARATRNGSPT